MAEEFTYSDLVQALRARWDGPLLGNFQSCEVTELVGSLGKPQKAVNIVSVLVAEERPPHAARGFLNQKPLTVPKLKGWSFGVYRHSVPLESVLRQVEALAHGSDWGFNGQALATGTLRPVPPQFVPADSTVPVPLNQILKNNFHAGSHLLELFDCDKKHVQTLLDTPAHLQALSERIQEYVPLRIASLSDRLGNIIIQIPVRTLVLTCKALGRDCVFSVKWRPGVAPRPCSLYAEHSLDETLRGATIAFPAQGDITIGNVASINRACLMDRETGLILAAFAPLGFMRTICSHVSLWEPEPRLIAISHQAGTGGTTRIPLTSAAEESEIGVPPRPETAIIRQRLYRAERERLLRNREFIQYGLRPGDADTKHERALEDIRYLIRLHGRKGVWLWDPYLCARDIMLTLFHAPVFGADLRGLSLLNKRTRRILASPAEGEEDNNTLSDDDWMVLQRNDFATPGNNYQGLRCEFRVLRDGAGPQFHDRFLIFPDGGDGPTAWSLGTSVNSVGRVHHILHKVTHGQLIADAFASLWDRLDDPHYLVWRHTI